jgi:DNA invertase Pin-like site-specific DNA recombinase
MDRGERRRGTRKAIVYIRQSSMEQVENNTGSKTFQRGLVEVARALGYPDDRIDVIDEDLGLSGSAVEHRSGYQRMVQEITAGEVDLVIAADASRISRDAGEWHHFLRLCGICGVTLHLDGKFVDPRKGDERFVTGLLAMAGEYDNWRRQETMSRGRLAKLKSGKAVTTPPGGYVWGPDGTWIKDARPGVQDSILAHFQAVREARSLRRAARLLRSRGVKTPVWRPGGAIGWTEPTVNSLSRMMHHPAYVGDVAFGATRSDPLRGRDRRGHWRSVKAPADEVIVVRDHHEPYVTRDFVAEIHALLERNALSKQHGVLGPGNALAQGMLRCSKHRMWLMRAVPKGRVTPGRDRYTYVCTGELLEGGRRCGNIPHWVIDRPLRDAVIERLSAPAVEGLLATIRQTESDAHSEKRRRRDELHRLRLEVQDMEFRYGRVDPNHWAVAASLEAKLEQKKRDLMALERQTLDALSAPTTFDSNCCKELQELCADLDSLLDATTTTPRDRKELVRIMVDVVILEELTLERARLRIAWRDGSPDTVREAVRPRYAHRVIWEMAEQGADAAAISARLNEEGVLTKCQTPWEPRSVRCQLTRMNQRRAAAVAKML